MKFGYKTLDSFVPIPKEMLRKAASMGFSSQEQKVFWFIIEKTIGFEEAKDGATKTSIRRTKQTLALSYFEISIGVPIRTTRDILKKLEKQRVVFMTKEYFPDSSKRLQQMHTPVVNENWDEWITFDERWFKLGRSIKDILDPKPDPKEVERIIRKIDEGYEFCGTTFKVENQFGELELVGEECEQVLARLIPFHPLLGKYYLNSGWNENEESIQLGFVLYEKDTLVAEACWNHKDCLVEIAKGGNINTYCIADMILIKECKFCYSKTPD
ncbi:MAG: hypothetical protein GY861_28195 [bacterium]|nr:hypothetical protein [bacterium]